jgi:hypothetical protein
MDGTTETKRRVPALVLAMIATAAALPAGAADDMFDGNWHFKVTPYLWLPYVDGTVNYNRGRGGSINAEVDPGSYLQNLDFAGMVTGEARKGEWSVFTDYIYLHLSGNRSPVRYVTDPTGNVGVPVSIDGSTSITSNVWTLAGSYTAWRGEQASVDVFGGVRFLNFQTTVGWNFATPIGTLPPGGSESRSFNEWDGIVGFKGQVRFGDSKWSMPYYVDIGTGSNNWTWQALLGVGYRFGWGELSLVVRSLNYYFDDDQLDLHLTGPALGATFNF